jgi:hypothetical protein
VTLRSSQQMDSSHHHFRPHELLDRHWKCVAPLLPLYSAPFVIVGHIDRETSIEDRSLPISSVLPMTQSLMQRSLICKQVTCLEWMWYLNSGLMPHGQSVLAVLWCTVIISCAQFFLGKCYSRGFASAPRKR